MTSKPLKVGCLGMGWWSDVLADAIQRSGRLEIVSCFTRSNEKREAFAKKYACRAAPSYQAMLEDRSIEAIINTTPNNVHLETTRAAAKATKPKTATDDYRALLDIKDLDAVIISAAPESTHYPMARDALLAGKHVFLEKPIAVEPAEADELISLARRARVKFTIGYSQRFNPKFAYVRKSLREGSIGKPVSALVSRHITRNLGATISGRSKLSPAAMESTHDIDFLLWCLEPAKPVRVYSQVNYGTMRERTGAAIPDAQWVTVTLDTGLSFVVGGGWSLPPGYPNRTDARRDAAFPGGGGIRPAGPGDARAGSRGDGNLYRGRPFRRAQRAGDAAAEGIAQAGGGRGGLMP
ncbi:MAG: Gfo/Idh/MocA family oxidoreductase [Proteobacteria bacterium]|nr:Gfo/Idh/MocA family oxidoreductase [Pseudomonadota bacterium]